MAPPPSATPLDVEIPLRDAPTSKATSTSAPPTGETAAISASLSRQPDAQSLYFLRPPVFSSPQAERAHVKKTLACAFRIFSRYGFDEGVTGHITVRDPIRNDCFWVNPMGMHFGLIKASDLILVDHSGRVIDGAPNSILNTAAFLIHGAIHVARPDVNCAAHGHTLYGRTWAAMGRELDMLTQDSCVFYKDHVVYNEYGGVVLGQSEGQEIARRLGNNKAALLQNHGIITVGQTIEEAIFWFVSMEKCCQTQLLADAAAAGGGYQTKKVGDEEAEFSYKIVGTPTAGYFSGMPMFAKMYKEEGKEFDDES